jgi:acid phosphatase (class A)
MLAVQVLLLVLWFGGFASAKDHAAYPILDGVNLSTLIAPPPAEHSDAQKAEFAELHHWQDVRTPAQIAYAQADQNITVYRFADVLGQKFTSDSLPLTTAFFAKTLSTGEAFSSAAKKFFNRPRPFLSDTTLTPVLGRPPNASYPSGHSTAGNLFAIVLANMIPEKSSELYARGWVFAENRVIGGVHYPSDIQAGRISAGIIADRLFANPDFLKDYAAAKAELRKQLGYTP